MSVQRTLKFWSVKVVTRKHKVAILYYSQSGNTKEFSNIVTSVFKKQKFFVQKFNVLKIMGSGIDLTQIDFSSFDVVIFGTSTSGLGQTPVKMQRFIDHCDIGKAIVLSFGTGDTQFGTLNYCKAADDINQKFGGDFEVGKVEQYPSSSQFIVATEWCNRACAHVKERLTVMNEEQKQDSLVTMFNMQKKVNDMVIKNHNLQGITQEEWILKTISALSNELEEVRDELNWKWWKQKENVNWEALKYEVVDVLAFTINLCSFAGMDAEELLDKYLKKSNENCNRQLGKSSDKSKKNYIGKGVKKDGKKRTKKKNKQDKKIKNKKRVK